MCPPRSHVSTMPRTTIEPVLHDSQRRTVITLKKWQRVRVVTILASREPQNASEHIRGSYAKRGEKYLYSRILARPAKFNTSPKSDSNEATMACLLVPKWFPGISRNTLLRHSKSIPNIANRMNELRLAWGGLDFASQRGNTAVDAPAVDDD